MGIEIERKYIIMIPTESDMSECEGFGFSDIRQIYLTSERGKTRRIRERRYPDSTEYYETVKMRIDSLSSTEIERRLTEEEFSRLEPEMAEGSRVVKKRRYTFLYSGKLFEIDVYPEWKRTCIMETELESRDEQVRMPPFIKILREVTGIKSYSNASMSRAFPPEEIV